MSILEFLFNYVVPIVWIIGWLICIVVGAAAGWNTGDPGDFLICLLVGIVGGMIWPGIALMLAGIWLVLTPIRAVMDMTSGRRMSSW